MQVFNNSWGAGPGNPNLPLAYSENTIRSYEQALSGTRGGRGGIYVKSAGNNFNNASISQTGMSAPPTPRTATPAACRLAATRATTCSTSSP